MKKVIQDIDKGLASYPLLQRVDDNGEIGVSGEIVLTHPDVGEYDRYSVSILLPKSYPYCLPKVVETSKKIPREADRHINTDFTLCLAVLQKEREITKNGIGFKFFLDKVLIPHLSRETYCEMNDGYEDGEYSHGVEGVWEYYEGVLSVSDKTLIVEELEKIIHSKWQGRNEPCFCSSGTKFKKCHLPKWNKIMSLGKSYVINQIEVLKQYK